MSYQNVIYQLCNGSVLPNIVGVLPACSTLEFSDRFVLPDSIFEKIVFSLEGGSGNVAFADKKEYIYPVNSFALSGELKAGFENLTIKDAEFDLGGQKTKLSFDVSGLEKYFLDNNPEDIKLKFSAHIDKLKFDDLYTLWPRYIAEKAWEEDGAHINSGFMDGMNKDEAMKAAIAFAEKNGFGKSKVNFKLRDWVFSRQRYWGEPIPMVYCEHCGWQPVPEDQLPLTLPEVPDYLPNDNGDSPLAKATDWVNTTCPKCGAPARRETDVMPNWAGSSWYFLRYCDPHNDKEFASKEALDYWMNVDWYNGGMEHTTLHLLYSRFWHKFLYDCGYVPTKEPYQRRTSHGMILAENGEKMSKSRGNVINPDDIVNNYGADSFRLYEMFIGPFDQVAMWSDDSLNGVYRFVGKVYNLFKKVNKNAKPSAKDVQMMHKTILEVTERIDQMKFNTAVSSLMTYVNHLSSLDEIAPELYENLLLLMCPFTPHLAEEMWARMGHMSLIITEPWPKGDAKLAEENTVTYAVQICGKMRGTIDLPKDAPREEVEKAALSLENVKRQLEGKEVKKVIVVPNKIINLVA